MLATTTVNPLHFEDLEPHRFEDLVRQLMYDFKDWKSIEALGKLGSDTGIDILAIESIEKERLTEDIEDVVENETSQSEERSWIIQCKREKVISPKKILEIIKHDLGQRKDLPFGYIIAASANFSKKSRDAFKLKLNSLGISEFYLFGKSELEDLLFLPKYDHLLFAYFGISLHKRKRAIKTNLSARQTMKRKLFKILGDFGEMTNKSILVKPPQDYDYPIIKDSLNLGWRYYKTISYEPVDHISFIIKKYTAYINWETKEWDIFEHGDLGFPYDPELYNFPKDSYQDIISKNQDSYSELEKIDEKFRGFYIIMRSIHFDRILIADELGDNYNEAPHIIVDYINGSPFEDKIYKFIEEDKPYSCEILKDPPLEKRIKYFK